MQIFGLIGLLVSIALTAWLFSIWFGTTNTSDDEYLKTQTYKSAIEAAEEASSQMGTQ